MRRLGIILVVGAVGCSVGFAAPDPAQDNSQQRMEQLRQLLAKATRNNNVKHEAAESSGERGAVSTAALPVGGGKDTPVGALTEKTLGAPSSGVATAPPAADLYDKAFSGVVNQILPMTPEQIVKLREIFAGTQMAAATPPGVPPKPTSTSLLVNLAPQAAPPTIRLGAGYITSLVFVDSTGQPWPIAAYSIGDPASFNIQWDQKGNTLLIQSSTFYKSSNLAVILRDLNTPVMLTLLSGQEAVDYRVDLRVPGIGPNAVFMQNGLPDSANPVLLEVLNGVSPKGSKELKVHGGNCQAWLLGNKLYLRTNLNVVSPGWQSVMSSVDGTRAYQMQPAPVILALQEGRDKILKIILEGLE